MTIIPPADPLHATRRGESAVLVGRDAELNAVRRSVLAPPSLIVIDGEAGIGKSRLVRELAASDLGDTRILLGHCQHLHEPLPLGPLLDAFHHHADRIDASGLSPAVGALAALIPELADRLPAAPPALPDHRAGRHRVFRAAVELLAHLTPAALILEDLHWADSGTTDFLAFLAAHQPDRLAVVVTARTEARPLPIREAFARAPNGPARTISLSPLGPDRVGELVGNIAGVEVSPAMAHAVFDTTGGIPFIVEEVLRTLLEHVPAAALVDDPTVLSRLSVPTALRDVVRQRMGALDPAARELLGVAAVIDLSIDPTLISEVSGYTAREVSTALGAALEAGLLHDEDGSGTRFRHVLAHQIVYDDVPAPTRRWLHLRVAQLVEERGGDRVPSARIAHHYRCAGATSDCLRHAEAAADQASAHGDDAGAAAFLLEAIDVGEPPLDTRLRLATKLGRAAVDGLAHSEAMPILSRLLAADLPPDVRGELRFALGRLHRQRGLARDGYREIERAVADLGSRPDLQARALAVLAAPETVIDRSISDHTARCDEAETVAAAAGAPEVVLAVRIARASLLIEQGRPEAWRLVDEVRRDPVLARHPREHVRACVNWAQAALHVGHLRRADELLAEGRRVADQAEYLRVSDVTDLVAAMVDHAAGRWSGLADRARDLTERPPGFDAAALDGRLLNAQMVAATGSPTEAVSLLNDVIADCERVGAVWPLIPARTTLARVLLTLDDLRGGAAAAAMARDLAGRKDNAVWTAEPMLVWVDATTALGHTGDDVADAASQVADLAARLDGADSPAAVAALRTAQAVLGRAGGDDVRACDLLVDARAILDKAGLVYQHAQVTERLGRWWCDLGVPAGAETLEAALRSYDGLSASRDVARVTQGMRRRGIPVPYPWRGGRRSHGQDLSRREHEVATLAAAGRTNREIAADLFLSPRTVESHVSHVLRKLGLQSRAELEPRLLRASSENGSA